MALGRAQLLAAAWCASGWPACAPGPPPRCRAAWGTGRPTAGRPVLQGPARKFSPLKIIENPLPPRSRTTRCRPPSSGEAGVYICKFRKQKYIFVKNEIEKYKNKKKREDLEQSLEFLAARVFLWPITLRSQALPVARRTSMQRRGECGRRRSICVHRPFPRSTSNWLQLLVPACRQVIAGDR